MREPRCPPRKTTQLLRNVMSHTLRMSALANLALVLSLSSVAIAQEVTEVIGPVGDGTQAFGGAYELRVSPSGTLIAGSYDTNCVFALDAGGTPQLLLDSSGDGTNSLSGVTGLCLDTDGNLYVAGWSSDNVFKVTPAGVVTQLLGPGGDGVTTLNSPYGVACGSDGNVYVASSGTDAVFKITPTGVISTMVNSSGDGMGNALDSPYGIAVDDQQNVYVAGWTSNNVLKVTPSGVVTAILTNAGDGTTGCLDCASVAVDSSGNVYATSRGTDSVFMISPSGSVTQVLSAAGDGQGGAAGGPWGVAVSASGEALISCWYSNNSFSITPSGTVTEVIDSTGDGGSGPLAKATGAAIGLGGEYYASGLDSNNVLRAGAIVIGTPYCLGDTVNSCPCGNAGAEGAGCSNSTGNGATLKGAGSVSMQLQNFQLIGTGLVPAQPGLFFQGDNATGGGMGVFFGDGLRCAGGGVVRLQVATADAAGGTQSTVNISQLGGASPGQTKFYQFWYRDPIGAPCNGGFNLTNGIQVHWTL